MEDVKGTVALRGWHDGRRIDGAAGNLDVQRLTMFDQPITQPSRRSASSARTSPDVLKFPGLMADYFGGQIYGPRGWSSGRGRTTGST